MKESRIPNESNMDTSYASDLQSSMFSSGNEPASVESLNKYA